MSKNQSVFNGSNIDNHFKQEINHPLPRASKQSFFKNLTQKTFKGIDQYFKRVKNQQTPQSLWEDINIIIQLYQNHYIKKHQLTLVSKHIGQKFNKTQTYIQGRFLKKLILLNDDIIIQHVQANRSFKFKLIDGKSKYQVMTLEQFDKQKKQKQIKSLMKRKDVDGLQLSQLSQKKEQESNIQNFNLKRNLKNKQVIDLISQQPAPKLINLVTQQPNLNTINLVSQESYFKQQISLISQQSNRKEILEIKSHQKYNQSLQFISQQQQYQILRAINIEKYLIKYGLQNMLKKIKQLKMHRYQWIYIKWINLINQGFDDFN